MGDATPHDARLRLATVELLGALAYGQLRAVELSARLIGLAPDVETATHAVDGVEQELASYHLLHRHLCRRTELPAAVMHRQRSMFDDYFDTAPTASWFDACVFFAVGAPIATDFARAVAPHLDPDDADAVGDALGDRKSLESEAARRLQTLLVDEPARQRARMLTADLLGRALTSFQHVMRETDALTVLLADGASADRGPDERQMPDEREVKEFVIELLTAHRRRTAALGIEDIDEEDR